MSLFLGDFKLFVHPFVNIFDVEGWLALRILVVFLKNRIDFNIGSKRRLKIGFYSALVNIIFECHRFVIFCLGLIVWVKLIANYFVFRSGFIKSAECVL